MDVFAGREGVIEAGDFGGQVGAIFEARFDGGMVGYLEVLDAQRDLVTAQQTATQVRRAQLDAAAQLYKALGGGSRLGT